MMVRICALVVLLSAPIVLTTEQTRDSADAAAGVPSVRSSLPSATSYGNLRATFRHSGALIGSTESGGAEYLAIPP